MKDETCTYCGHDLEDTDGVPGRSSAVDGDFWCPSCEVGFETYELNDIKVDEDEDDEFAEDGF